MKNQTILGHLSALITILIWGTTFISTKILLFEFTPLEILASRFLLAYLFWWLVHPKTEKWKSIGEEVLFFCLGLTGITLYFFLENMALQFTLASNVGLLVATAPLLTAVIAHYFVRGERLKRGVVFGFLLAVLGVFLVMGNGRFVVKVNPKGDFLALGAALLWAVYTILLKRVDSGYHPIFVVRKTFFYGLITMLPLVMILPGSVKTVHSFGGPMIGNILFLGLAASALCFVLWNRAIRTLGAVRVTNYIYLVPLITMVTSVIVLHEPVTGFMVAGACLICGGVYLSEHELSSKSGQEIKAV